MVNVLVRSRSVELEDLHRKSLGAADYNASAMLGYGIMREADLVAFERRRS